MLSALCSVSHADIFGPQPAKATAGISVDPATILDYLAQGINYLGVKEGGAYDFEQGEFCTYSAATLYTYQPWSTSLDIGMLNIDGAALTVNWNAGNVIPCEQVPILKMFKYLYIGGGIGTRYLEGKDGKDDWKLAPIVDAQFKVTF